MSEWSKAATISGISTALPIIFGAASSYSKGADLSKGLERNAQISGLMLANVLLFRTIKYYNGVRNDAVSNFAIEQFFTLLASQHSLTIMSYGFSLAEGRNTIIAEAIKSASIAFAIKAQGAAFAVDQFSIIAAGKDFFSYFVAFSLKAAVAKTLFNSYVPEHYQCMLSPLLTSFSYTVKYALSSGFERKKITMTGLANSIVRGAGNDMSYMIVDLYSQDIKPDTLSINFGNSIRALGIPELLSALFDSQVNVMLT